MAKEIVNPLYDRRVIDRNIRTGSVDRKEYERWLKGLDDDAKNAIAVDTQLDESGVTPRSSSDEDEG